MTANECRTALSASPAMKAKHRLIVSPAHVYNVMLYLYNATQLNSIRISNNKYRFSLITATKTWTIKMYNLYNAVKKL